MSRYLFLSIVISFIFTMLIALYYNGFPNKEFVPNHIVNNNDFWLTIVFNNNLIFLLIFVAIFSFVGSWLLINFVFKKD